MVQAKFIPIMTSTTGLNNTLDPVRLAYDLKTGVTELAQAVNINIDNSRRPSRRLGRSAPKRAEASRCGFVDGETCLFVAGSALYQLHPDYSRTSLRTGLTVGARMRYYPIAGRIYYSNGTEKGYIYKGQNYTWTKGDYTATGDTRRVLSDPPSGHIVSWFAGRALIARENAIFSSEPSFYGVFDLHNGFKLVRDRITMLQPTPGGLWVGTTKQVLFYRGSQWEQLRREIKADHGVLEGSDAWREPTDEEERVLFLTTPQGVCTASEGGTLKNVTYNKLTFPSARYASGAIVGDRYIVLIEP